MMKKFFITGVWKTGAKTDGAVRNVLKIIAIKQCMAVAQVGGNWRELVEDKHDPIPILNSVFEKKLLLNTDHTENFMVKK